jgi:hypothetical protein
MKNLFILPTDKPSRLFTWGNKLRLGDLVGCPDYFGKLNKNISITNDEEIKEGDWCTDGSYLIQATPKLVDTQGLFDRRDWRKIILTTDQDLIKDGVQAIDDNFLEWFVKNPSCEFVEVDKNWNYPLDKSWEYKLRIIPKEEPKQETLEEAFKKTYLGQRLFFDSNEGKSFEEGAKWQQEQIGKSEFLQKLRATLSDAKARRLIFETFKDKHYDSI